jgi:transposase
MTVLKTILLTCHKVSQFETVTQARAGCYIKPLLVQCATSVVKSENHPEIRNRYLKLKKRRGHKRAIIAIARMLLTAIYNILKRKKHTMLNYI